MGKGHIRNRVLGILFWIKVLFSILFAGAAITYMCREVFVRYKIQSRITQIKEGEKSKPIVISPDNSNCDAGKSRFARLEPPGDETMIGFHLNWQLQTPQDARRLLGRNPAIINAFLQLNAAANPPIRWPDFIWHSQEIAKINAIFALTIEPVDIENVPDSILEDIAKQCLEINKKGVPMFLRYGHEMNGDWTDYGVQPVRYVNGFRKMARMIRRYTNLTAMVWGPNVGINYPFNGTAPQRYPTNLTDPINFRALDTNNDGIINYLDDPYGPYYPGTILFDLGDEYVDWVALSLYWYPDAGTGFNTHVPPTYFADSIRGSGPTVEYFNPDVLRDGGLRNFYKRFAQDRNKPMMIPETSAPYFDTHRGEATELQIKQEWWSQLYGPAVHREFPLLKCIIHFEERKADFTSEIRDWRILANPAVKDAFNADMDKIRSQVLYSNDMEYGCDGSIKIKPLSEQVPV